MEVLAMKLIHHPLRIRIILVEDVLTFPIPPEPILYDVIRRNVQLPVFPRDSQYFLLRPVSVLALPEAISPFAEHGRLPRQFAVIGNDLVESRAVEEVIIDVVGHFGADVEVVCETVVEPTA